MPAAWQKWMPIYIQRLKSNPYVIAMHPAAVTGYLWLVMEQWQSDDCTLPNDVKHLKVISGLGLYWQDYADEILDRFKSVGDNRLRNDFCYELWMEAKARYEEGQQGYEALREIRSKAGKIGAEKKWQKSGKCMASAKQVPSKAPAKDGFTDTGTSTETKEQKLKATPLSEKSDDTPPAEFANAWNRLKGPLPQITQFTDSRKKKIQARQRQGISLEEFEKAVSKCASIPFLAGDNKQGWKADFDWLVDNDKNLLKVLEGKYDAGESNGASKDNSGSNGTRGAAVGRVERGQSAFRQAAIASVEAAGGFPAGPDDSSLPFAGTSPGHGADVPARSGDASGGVRDSSRGNGAGVVSHAPEILPPSQRNPGGLGSHGSQRAH